MENYEIIKDSPPANAIDQKVEKFFPIIRCEDCHEILSINLKIDKKKNSTEMWKRRKSQRYSLLSIFWIIPNF